MFSPLTRFALSISVLSLISACGSRSSLPSSVSYSRLSTQRSTTSQSSFASSPTGTAGSRLTARQSGMQDVPAEDFENPEDLAAQDALIDSGSMVDPSAEANDDAGRSARSGGCANADYNEQLVCSGVPASMLH